MKDGDTKDTRTRSRFKPEWCLKYQRILYMTVKNQLTQDQIASKIGMHRSTISDIVSWEEFRKRRAKMEAGLQAQIKDILESYAVKAVRKIAQISNSGKPEQKVQLEAAKEILHQLGFKPVEVVENRSRNYTPEEIASAHKTISETKAVVDRLMIRDSVFVLKPQKSEAAPKPEVTTTDEQSIPAGSDRPQS